MSTPDVNPAAGTVVGKGCPHCEQLLIEGAPFVSCPTCLTPQHASCWSASGEGCGSYYCTQETSRPVEDMGPAAIVITKDETDRPPPPARALPRRPAPSPVAVRTDPYAKAAILLVPASLGCFGPISTLLGAISLGRIAATSELKGRGLAVAAMLLGVLTTFGWIGGAVVYGISQQNRVYQGPSPFLAAAEIPEPPSAEVLARVPAHIRRALRSNVFIEGSKGFGRWVGSGIVVEATSTHIRVLTNRHVADGDPPSDDCSLTVRTVQGNQAPATVLWRAPDGIDVALIEAVLPGADELVDVARVADAALEPTIGTKVFAIGNPHALGWTYNEGVVSAVREHTQGAESVTFLQTDTAINPGNSGGGLYDESGLLVGMNSWKISDTVGEGLSFAIALTSILKLKGDLAREATAEELEEFRRQAIAPAAPDGPEARDEEAPADDEEPQ